MAVMHVPFLVDLVVVVAVLSRRRPRHPVGFTFRVHLPHIDSGNF